MAAKSKSGLIRQYIGPRRARLQEIIHEAQALADQVGAVAVDDTIAVKDLEAKIQTIVKLETRVDKIEQQHHKWQILIEGLPQEEIEDEERVHEQFISGEDYLVVTDDGKEQVGLLKLVLKQTSDAVANNIPAQQRPITPVAAGIRRYRTVELPKLVLPEFHGDGLLWNQFWAIFRTNIDSSDLSGVEKLTYLRGQLRGSALNAIDGLEITDSSYQIAVDILKERFERTSDQVIGSLYSNLKRLPTSANKVADLQQTYDNCEKIFRQLKIEGEDVDSNRSLVMDVMSKYPSDVVKELTRRKGVGTHSTISAVQKGLQQYITETHNLHGILGDLESFVKSGNSPATAVRSDQKYPSPGPKGYGHPGKEYGYGQQESTTSALTSMQGASSGNSNDQPPKPCYFCDGPHFNSRCDKYRSIDQRRKRLTELKRCCRCMASSHLTAECRTTGRRLRCFFCNELGTHASPLCPQKFDSKMKTASQEQSAVYLANDTHTDNLQHPTETVSTLCTEERSLLSTAVTYISNPDTGARKQIRLVLDSGSHRSYVNQDVVDYLGLSPTSEQPETLSVAVFGIKQPWTVTSGQVRFDVQLRGGQSTRINANTIEMITSGNLSYGSLPPTTRKMVETMKDEMADNFAGLQGPPDVLIGSDYFWEFLTAGNRLQTDDGIYLIPTSLGIVLGGRYLGEVGPQKHEPVLVCITHRATPSIMESYLVNQTTDCIVDASYPDVDEFWQLETIGITDDPTEDDDVIAQRQFNEDVSFANGRYQVGMPWNGNQHKLSTNWSLAYGRLRSLATQLQKVKPTVRREYKKVIEHQLSVGIIEEVPPSDYKSTLNIIHYLPHHPVVREGHETTKLRVVYDASSKCRKDVPSLNECLYRGPVILPDLCSVLIRFRTNNIAIVADIEKAFLQIELRPSDRDATRFLWFKDPDNPDPNDFIVLRFARVLFGAICSPFLLAAVVQHHLSLTDCPVASEIRDNIYVDNVVSGVEDDATGKNFYTTAKSLMDAANMNLREWCSNSDAVMSNIPAYDRTSQRLVTVLGVTWDSQADTIRLQNTWATRVSCTTKREVLRATASIFDPMGWFQPCTQQAKSFLRDLWNDNVGWDEQLNAELQTKWKSLHHDIAPMFDVTRARKVIDSNDSCDISIVAFSDASIDTYAAAVYIRCIGSLGSHTELVFAKSRLSPHSAKTTAITLPRLELLGLTIATKAAEFVRTALAKLVPLRIFLLTDSSCVMGWLRSDKPLPRFVTNRVKIMRNISNAEFHHVRSEDNPADLATRGVAGSDIGNATLWWSGPDWLRSPSMEWPTTSVVAKITDVELQELESRSLAADDVFPTLLVGEGLRGANEVRGYPFGIDPSDHSTFGMITRTTGWALKFLKTTVWDHLSPETRMKHPSLRRILDTVTTNDHLTAADIRKAKNLWIRNVQMTSYHDVFVAIAAKKQHQLINQLNVGIDDEGMLRCYGRLTLANVPSDTIRPLLLPKGDPVTDLIIRDVHEKLFHSGIGHTLNQLRREFWIPQGRNAVRRVLARCRVCRRLRGPPFALPKMPPWPRERLSQAAPFQFSGVDYLGPINISVNDETQKMWVCLFTCLAVRSVHLEPVTDCTAGCFVDCLSRFVARRGTPEQMISDNAPQFRLAKTLMDRTWHGVMTDDAVQTYISSRGISWKFTTELAPWQGGIYERLVGIVKNCLKSAIGRRLLRWDHFVTLLAEVEAIVNSRPITYVYSDIHSGKALRPVDFLTDLPTGNPTVDPTLQPEGGEASRRLLQYWKSKQRRIGQVWQQWSDDYLLSLREASRSDHRNRRSDVRSHPSVDEVVLVKNSDAPRGAWKLGRITKTIVGNDGAIRSAELQLPNRQVIRRAINQLFPLEIPTAIDPPLQQLENDVNPVHVVSVDDEEPFYGFTEDEAYPNGNNTFAGSVLTSVPQPPEIIQLARVNIRQQLRQVAFTIAFVKSSGL